MVSLAELYESGRGIASDRAAALALYRRAVDSGHAAAEPAMRRIEEQLGSAKLAG
jgi:TPR repeat protein